MRGDGGFLCFALGLHFGFERFGFGLRDDFLVTHALGADVAQVELIAVKVEGVGRIGGMRQRRFGLGGRSGGFFGHLVVRPIHR